MVNDGGENNIEQNDAIFNRQENKAGRKPVYRESVCYSGEISEHFRMTGEHFRGTGEHFRGTGEHFRETGEHFRETGERFRETGERVFYSLYHSKSIVKSIDHLNIAYKSNCLSLSVRLKIKSKYIDQKRFVASPGIANNYP
jgi:hypothetical protein